MKLKEKVKALCQERGISVRRFENDLGISNGNVKHWDTSMPSGDKLVAIAKYFGVSVDYLLDDTVNSTTEYYDDPEVSMMTQQLKDRPELKILFDASKNLKKEDIEFVLDMIERMK